MVAVFWGPCTQILPPPQFFFFLAVKLCNNVQNSRIRKSVDVLVIAVRVPLAYPKPWYSITLCCITWINWSNSPISRVWIQNPTRPKSHCPLLPKSHPWQTKIPPFWNFFCVILHWIELNKLCFSFSYLSFSHEDGVLRSGRVAEGL